MNPFEYSKYLFGCWKIHWFLCTNFHHQMLKNPLNFDLQGSRAQKKNWYEEESCSFKSHLPEYRIHSIGFRYARAIKCIFHSFKHENYEFCDHPTINFNNPEHHFSSKFLVQLKKFTPVAIAIRLFVYLFFSRFGECRFQFSILFWFYVRLSWRKWGKLE